MKNKTVIAVIVVLFCYCLSFGNGNRSIYKVRGKVRQRYVMLSLFLNPDVHPSRDTINRYIKQVEDQEKIQAWIQKVSGYSHEQLSNPPKLSMNVNLLKMATEYHLWLQGWYRARCMTLSRAAKRHSKIKDRHPRILKCKNAASKAYEISETHKKLYKKYYEALGEAAKRDIMGEIKFPNYIDDQTGSENYIFSEGEIQKLAESEAISNVKNSLNIFIKKMSLDADRVRNIRSIRTSLSHFWMAPKESFLSDIRHFFPVEELSQPSDEASRSDREFVEVAWLLNRYRSLWYEKRHKDLLIFLREHKEGHITQDFLQQVEEAKTAAKTFFQRYQSLCNDYYERLKKPQPDKIAVVQKNQSKSHVMELVGQTLLFEDDPLEQIHCRRKRNRKTLKKTERMVSQKNHETPEHQFFEECLENVRANGRIPGAPDALPVGAMEVDCQTEEETSHTGKRYKDHEDHTQAGHQAEQSDILAECPDDFNHLTSNPSNENAFMEVFQDFTIAVSADSDLQFSVNLDQIETGAIDDDLAMGHVPYIDALWNHQPYFSTPNEGTPLGTASVSKVNQNAIARDVFHEAGLERENSHDEEFLEVLMQPSSENVYPSCLQNCHPHNLIENNENTSSASIVTVEHIQTDGPSVVDETDAIIEEQEESLGLKEIQEAELMEFHRWLRNYLEPDFSYQTPESAEAHEITTFSQDGTDASKITR